MDTSDAIQIIIMAILLMFSAFFSSAETALTTVSKITMRSMADDGNKRAAMVLEVVENKKQKMISAILIGNNIVNLYASSLMTTFATRVFGNKMVGIATGVLTLLILIFGEITPKNLATYKSTQLSLLYIPVIRVLITVMTPLIFLLNLICRVMLRLFGVDPNAKTDAMTEDDLRTIVDVSHEDGVIESDEKEMIYNVFDLGDAKAKDVMVPRINVTFADVNCTYEELIEIFKEEMHTRLPIYEDTTDNIVGIINMKDILLFDDKEHFSIRKILREAYFTYEYKSISELLVEMRSASLNIAIVLDEYGETAGLITLEDILEEIVGEIHDEYDENEEEFFKQINDHEYIVEGSLSLDDVNDRLNLELESEDFDSLGGFIIQNLERVPEIGDEFTTEEGIRIVVEKMDKNRVEEVHMYLPKEPVAKKTDSGNSDNHDN
ncbi:MAG: HlyC/CorC family transporter [Ruminococcus sp.]|nr:HlyC/CorC family transporter [Ruminococcus sp.]